MLLATGQHLLNEQIRASTAARERLRDLDGKRIAVAVKDSDLRILIESAAGALRLSYAPPGDGEPVGDCDVELSAGAFDLLRLARSASLSELRDAGAVLNGDIHVAEAFAELLRLAMPEPEAVLAARIGDLPAHVVGRAARGAARWTRRAGRAFELNLAEYLQEESPALVPPALARDFAAEVDRLRDDVERAERRIEHLGRKLGMRAG